MINRRNFLKNASLLAAGSFMASKVGSAAASNVASIPSSTMIEGKKVIGLQVYSLFSEFSKDVPAGLKRIKAIGYTNLENASYDFKTGKTYGYSMKEFKQMVEDNGLKVLSAHVNPPIRDYTTASNREKVYDFWKKCAADHAELGVKYLVQPGLPQTNNVEEVKTVAEVFNKAGEIVKGNGFPFGYHNHNSEFYSVVPGGKEPSYGRGAKGDKIYDLFLANTDPEKVFFEMDVYWTVMGMNDPVDYLQRFANRIKLLHIKDRFVLGQSGMMNFEMIFKTFYANGYKDYFVELEGMPHGETQFDGVKGCCEYLQKSKFVK